MSDPRPQVLRSLEEQRAEYAGRRGLAMPLEEMAGWTLIGVAVICAIVLSSCL